MQGGLTARLVFNAGIGVGALAQQPARPIMMAEIHRAQHYRGLSQHRRIARRQFGQGLAVVQPGDEAKGIGAKWLEPEDEWKKRCRVRRGYCGLGGKPEFGYADEN